MEEFFETHLKNLGYLVDGSRYNLQFTIQHSDNSDSFIRTVSTTLLKDDMI